MLELSAKIRAQKGRGLNQLRKQGLIPAVSYGQKTKNLSLMVDAQDFEKIYQQTGQSTLIKLKAEDKEKIVLIHDIQKDPVTDKVIHIDFYQVRMDRLLKTEVPLVFVGESPAVQAEGGVLIKNIQKVEIEALPKDLPREIEVDISSLKTFDDNIYIKNLSLPEGVKIITEAEEVVASVIPPRAEAELEELEKAPEEKVEEVKVEAEEKREAKVEEVTEEKPAEEKEEK